MAIKSSSSSPKKIILDIKGPKEVKQRISLSSRNRNTNPEQTICNLDEKTNFHMELMVSTGKGYVQAQKNKSEDSPLDISMDFCSVLLKKFHTQ